ncbi:patatin-like phospholipase domain-containing protein 2 [Diretmus argenteus]
MFDLKKEWCISFAGCGFMGIYYIGATSCIFERFPRLVQDASRIYGASAGALIAAMCAIGIPVEKACADLMSMAKRARKSKLGPLHPAFNLLQIVRGSLLENLPEDAHVRASGKLCVSLTRVSNGKNVLVSQFDSREELIQTLICSCFIPFYCGVIPPTYRGVRYMDGAISDNLPRCHLENTITISAFSGESDICPRGSALNFHQVRFNNVSIQVNAENMYRVASTFFPPEPEIMAEICQSGYMDALRFLQENVLCEACRERHAAGSLLSQVTELPVRVASYLRTRCAPPVESARSLAQRLAHWIPDVSKDMSWVYVTAGDLYKQAWENMLGVKEHDGELPLRRCTSLPSGLDLWNQSEEEVDAHPLTQEATPTYSYPSSWNSESNLDQLPLTPPSTPPFNSDSGFGEAATPSPLSAGGGWGSGLGRAVGWIRNIVAEQTSNPKRLYEPASSSCFK